jgi:hypothetical protein
MDNQKANEVYDLAHSDEPIAPRVKEALKVIDQALDDFEWVASFSRETDRAHRVSASARFEHLALSFNGGKDCASSALFASFNNVHLIGTMQAPFYYTSTLQLSTESSRNAPLYPLCISRSHLRSPNSNPSSMNRSRRTISNSSIVYRQRPKMARSSL